jgi:TPR repeat protein
MAKPSNLGECGKISNLHVLYPKDQERLDGSNQPTDLLMAAAEDDAPEAVHHPGCKCRAESCVGKAVPAPGSQYRKAAVAGSSMAQFSLGLALISGDGVAQDYDEALMWLSLAAKGGDPGMSRECSPYILLLSLAIGPERTGKAVSAARQLLSLES